MRIIITISFLLMSFTTFSQVPKDTVNVLNANTLNLYDSPDGSFVYPVLIGGLWGRASLLGTRKYMGARIGGSVAYNPSPTGNPLADYNKFVTGTDSNIYFIDSYGNSILINTDETSYSTYRDDLDAQVNGVLVGEKYLLSPNNSYGFLPYSERKRIN